jgi:hypothetical protein
MTSSASRDHGSMGERDPQTVPFVRLLYRTVSRDVSLEHALSQVGTPEIAASVTCGDLLQLSEFARERTEAGDTRNALVVQRLLFAALEANPDPSEPGEGSNLAHYTWTTVAQDLLRTIHGEVTRVPDGRLLRLARRAAEAALPHARHAEDSVPAGRLLRQTGGLHLDPYIVGLHRAFEDHRKLWLQRLRDERGDELAGIPDGELVMPSPVDAFTTSAEYSRRAVPLLEGHARGAALKALAQALVWLDRYQEPVDRAELCAATTEALQLLDPQLTPQYVTELRGYLEAYGWA